MADDEAGRKKGGESKRCEYSSVNTRLTCGMITKTSLKKESHNTGQRATQLSAYHRKRSVMSFSMIANFRETTRSEV